MHICYLTIDYHSALAGGGIGSYLQTMVEAMVARGHRVTVIVLSNQNKIKKDGAVEVIEVAAPNVHWYFYRALPFAKSLAMLIRELEWSHCLWSALVKLIKRESVDVVETGESAGFWRLFISHVPPVIVRGHGNTYAIEKASGKKCSFGNWLARRLELMGMRRASTITAVSRFQAKEIAQELNLPVEDIPVIYNPISPKLLEDAHKTKSNISNTFSPMMLYTGRIEYRKGSIPLLESIPFISKIFPDIQCVIAGARHSSIDDLTLNKVLDKDNIRVHVKLLGHIPWLQLADCYQQANVFIMPSYYETFGISVVEAMAFGLPVVATTVGGLPEVVEDGVTGILVAPGDPKALAEAVIRLLRDTDLARRMGEAGRQRVLAEFNVDKIADKTLKVYEAVLKR